MIKKINLTNEIDSFNNNGFIIFDKFLLEENIAQRLTNFKIFVPQNIPNIRLLPWYHLPIIKEKIKDKSFTHFMYLEDDISISRENISKAIAKIDKILK